MPVGPEQQIGAERVTFVENGAIVGDTVRRLLQSSKTRMRSVLRAQRNFRSFVCECDSPERKHGHLVRDGDADRRHDIGVLP